MFFKSTLWGVRYSYLCILISSGDGCTKVEEFGEMKAQWTTDIKVEM